MNRSGNGPMGPPPFPRQPDGHHKNNKPMNDSIGYYGRGPGPGPNGNRSSFPNQYGFDSRHPPQNQLPPMQAQPPPAMKEPLTYFQMCIPRTRTIAHYKRIEQIGEGTYGQVYKATCLSSSTIVALKKIRLTSVATEGLPRTVIREIKILKALKHENMVQMMEVVSSKGFEDLDEEDEHKEDKKKRLKDEQQLGKNGSSSDQKSSSKPNNNELTNQNTEREKYKGNLFLVLEYISHDLSGVLDMGIRFTPVQSKCIFRQLLSVLQYMHEKRYVHRDLKSSNILIDERYRVKLADFGLARSLDDEFDWQTDRNKDRKLTNKVVTIWYRCPELLLGATDYDEKVDIWSAGCILAELLLGKALFPGTNEVEQLRLIFKMMGTPSEENWEGLNMFPKIKSKEMEIGKPMSSDMRDKYGNDERFTSSPSSLALIERLLELDPRKRWRAKQALESQYFRSKPQAPTNPEELGTIPIAGDSHEFQTKPIRKEAKVVAQKASADAKKKGGNEKEAYDNAYKDYLAKAAASIPTKGDLNKKEKIRDVADDDDGGDKDRKRRRRDDDSKEKRDRREKDRDSSKKDHSRHERKSEKQDVAESEKVDESDMRDKKTDQKTESRSSRGRERNMSEDMKENSRSSRSLDRDDKDSKRSRRESHDSGRQEKRKERDKSRSEKYRKEKDRDKSRHRDRKDKDVRRSRGDKDRKERGSNDRVDKDRKERGSDDRSDKERGSDDRGDKDRKERGSDDRGDKDRKERGSNDRSDKDRKDRGSDDRGDKVQNEKRSNEREEKDRKERGSDDRRDKGHKERGSSDRRDKDKRDRHRHRSSRDRGSRDRGSRRSRDGHDRRERDRRYDGDGRRGDWGGDERGDGRRDYPPREWERPRDGGPPPPGWNSRDGPRHRDDRYRR